MAAQVAVAIGDSLLIANTQADFQTLLEHLQGPGVMALASVNHTEVGVLVGSQSVNSFSNTVLQALFVSLLSLRELALIFIEYSKIAIEAAKVASLFPYCGST